jgi:hypothetical protein
VAETVQHPAAALQMLWRPALRRYVVLGETLTPLQLLGAAITLGAVALLNSKSSQAKQA